jgi:nucleoside-diphosphate-sugar epimerase
MSSGGISYVAVGDICSDTDWAHAIRGVDCVIHCAARIQVMNETDADALVTYRTVNVNGTRRLAEQAAAAGIKRLIFLSSLKASREPNGDVRSLVRSSPAFGPSGHAETKRDLFREDFYGISKWEAEQTLWEISARTGLEVVIVRAPLVYGPVVKGNLRRLLNLVRLGLPLPMGSLKNKRSLVGLDNLVDLLIRCVDHPAAAGQTLLVSDGEDLSTPDLLRQIAVAMRRPARIFPVPVTILRLAGYALGKRAEIDRLVGSLQIDSSHTRQVLGWAPPVGLKEGMRRMVGESRLGQDGPT